MDQLFCVAAVVVGDVGVALSLMGRDGREGGATKWGGAWTRNAVITVCPPPQSLFSYTLGPSPVVISVRTLGPSGVFELLHSTHLTPCLSCHFQVVVRGNVLKLKRKKVADMMQQPSTIRAGPSGLVNGLKPKAPVAASVKRPEATSLDNNNTIKSGASGGTAGANSSAQLNDFKTKTVLKEAVDAVVSSFAKHSHGYGRGKNDSRSILQFVSRWKSSSPPSFSPPSYSFAFYFSWLERTDEEAALSFISLLFPPSSFFFTFRSARDGIPSNGVTTLARARRSISCDKKRARERECSMERDIPNTSSRL